MLPPGVDEPEIYTAVRSGDFLADAKIAWRDAYELHLFRLRLNLD